MMEKRIPELDGLRALAVLAVLYTHFANENSALGHYGVRLFFVLSAFLITGLLVQARDSQQPFVTSLKSFFTSRFFRIVPAYALMILAVVAMTKHIGPDLPFHALFVSNYWFFITADWQPWEFAALWTLSVEWQFYLLWPLAVLVSSDHKIRAYAFALIGSAVIFWALAIWQKANIEFAGLLTPASCDALGAGVLARLSLNKLMRPTRWKIALGLCAAAATPVLIWLSSGTSDPQLSLAFRGASEFMPLYPAALLISASSSGSRNALSFILRSAPLAWIGTISYGIYLYHLPVLAFAIRLKQWLPAVPVAQSASRFFVLSAMTIAVAAVSWVVFERPMMRVGRRLRDRQKLPPDIRPK